MVYQFPWYIPAAIYAVALIPFGFGISFIFQRKALPLILVMFGITAFVGGIIGPTIARDIVTIDSVKLEQRTGFWFYPTVKGFTLQDTEAVSIHIEVSDNGLDNEMWTVIPKEGVPYVINPGDLWEMHSEEISEILRKNGIAVTR